MTDLPAGIALLTPKEVAAMLRLSRQYVYKMAKNRELASVKIGGAIRFDPKDVASYVSEHTRERRTGE